MNKRAFVAVQDNLSALRTCLDINYVFSATEFQGVECLEKFNIFGVVFNLLKVRNPEKRAVVNGEAIRVYAYAVTTSGTTGQPKVVKVPYHCILANIKDFVKILGGTSTDRVAYLTPRTFDPSIIEVFFALASGATLVTFSQDLKNDPFR